MKVAIITDTHFGGKNDLHSFSQFQTRFYRGTFFPILAREGIDTILHLGDVFDRQTLCSGSAFFYHRLAEAVEVSIVQIHYRKTTICQGFPVRPIS